MNLTEARAAAAPQQASFDRWDAPTRPGCKADHHRRGWIPGRRYFIGYWGTVDYILGYRLDGTVDVRGENGEVRNHSTVLHRNDILLVD